MQNKVLGLDVGGTNVRIAVINADTKPLILKKENYLTKNVDDLSKIINQFGPIESGCVGFAGPIVGDKAKLTNAHLKIDLKELKRHTKLREIVLINDFHAIGYGVPYLKKSDFLVLNHGGSFKKNNVQMVVGPGTGLGKAYIIDKDVYPCEGGLTAVGIEDISDYALVDYLKAKYSGPVYYEDIVSGRGLIDIYDHLEIKSNLEVNMKIRKLIKEEPVNKAKLITTYSSKDQLCDMTLRIFTKFYARFVRDSALNLISAKVYLVGGISKAIKPYLKKYFLEEFLKHRKYTPLLKKVYVSVILNEDVGLIGAGAVAGKLV